MCNKLNQKLGSKLWQNQKWMKPKESDEQIDGLPVADDVYY